MCKGVSIEIGLGICAGADLTPSDSWSRDTGCSLQVSNRCLVVRLRAGHRGDYAGIRLPDDLATLDDKRIGCVLEVERR